MKKKPNKKFTGDRRENRAEIPVREIPAILSSLLLEREIEQWKKILLLACLCFLIEVAMIGERSANCIQGAAMGMTLCSIYTSLVFLRSLGPTPVKKSRSCKK